MTHKETHSKYSPKKNLGSHAIGQFWIEQHANLALKYPLSYAETVRLFGSLEIDPNLILGFYYPLSLHLADKIISCNRQSSNSKTSNIFIIGIAGSVCVGKSSITHILQQLLQRIFESIQTLATDNFLLSNQTLKNSGIFEKKGHPMSYNYAQIERFLDWLQQPTDVFKLRKYNHQSYDIGDEIQLVKNNIPLILEGLNVLQTPEHIHQYHLGNPEPETQKLTLGFLPYLDVSLFIEASSEHLKKWYCERFQKKIHRNLTGKTTDHFSQYQQLTEAESQKVALGIWEKTNKPVKETHTDTSAKQADIRITLQANHGVESVSF